MVKVRDSGRAGRQRGVPALMQGAGSSGDVPKLCWRKPSLARPTVKAAGHMLSRWQTKRRFMVWLLLPIFFLGTAVAVVVIGTIAHFANN